MALEIRKLEGKIILLNVIFDQNILPNLCSIRITVEVIELDS